MRMPKPTLRALSTLLVCAAAGCSGNTLGTLGDILGSGMPSGATSGQLNAEVRQVDTQNRQIQVLTSDNQSAWVQYDQNTVVVYNQQQYAVTSLERGDYVRMYVQQDSRGTLFTNRIDVTQSAQDRTGGTYGDSRIMQFYGRVTSIDQQRGTFVLQTQNGSVIVSLPYNPPRATSDYFYRLRAGDTVRLEATMIGTNRAEIYRFL
jgi:hypothetical protein